MRKAVFVLCLSILALSISLAARAQAVYGSVVGTVVDSSGAGVPNAKVTITDLSRAVSFATATNESGFFTQRSLIGGVTRYESKRRASAPTFRSSRSPSIRRRPWTSSCRSVN